MGGTAVNEVVWRSGVAKCFEQRTPGRVGARPPRASLNISAHSQPYVSDGFWMNLRGHCDIEVERERLGGTLADIEPVAS